MERTMTIEDVKQYLTVLNKNRKLVETGYGSFEVRFDSNQLIRREVYDQVATDKMNAYLQQPGRCLLFKVTLFNQTTGPDGYRCYFFDNNSFCLTRLSSEEKNLYTTTVCYVAFSEKSELRLRSRFDAKATIKWAEKQMREFAAESSLFRLSLVTGALSFAGDRY